MGRRYPSRGSAMLWGRFCCNLSSMLMLIKWPVPEHFHRPWYSMIVGEFSAGWCPLLQKLGNGLSMGCTEIFTSSLVMIMTAWFSLNRKSVFSKLYWVDYLFTKGNQHKTTVFQLYGQQCILYTPYTLIQPEQSETLTMLNSYIIFWGNKEKCYCKHFR